MNYWFMWYAEHLTGGHVLSVQFVQFPGVHPIAQVSVK